MDYTVSLLTSTADCEALINIANSDKEGLSYRKTGLVRQREAASTTSLQIETELASVTAEITALQTVMNNLPDGPIKDDTLVKLRKAEYKKFLLEQRKGNYGVLSLLQKEYDIATTEKDISEAEEFIIAVTDRMNTLK